MEGSAFWTADSCNPEEAIRLPVQVSQQEDRKWALDMSFQRDCLLPLPEQGHPLELAVQP